MMMLHFRIYRTISKCFGENRAPREGQAAAGTSGKGKTGDTKSKPGEAPRHHSRGSEGSESIGVDNFGGPEQFRLCQRGDAKPNRGSNQGAALSAQRSG